MKKSFASQGDIQKKEISFDQLAEGVYAYTAQGDPNSGVIIGDECVMVIEAQATPIIAKDLIDRIKLITDKPMKYLVLTHYHAVRVLGASAYGADEIISSTKTYEMIVERGEQDWLSEFQRFPRLFEGHESIPGLTWPTRTFDDKMTLDLGNRIVEIFHPGEGHTRGDAVVWLPKEKVLFAGDIVEYEATPYCGDAQLAKWPETLSKLEKLKAQALVPGRGEALKDEASCFKAIQETREFVRILLEETKASIKNNETLYEAYHRIVELMKPQFGHWVIFEHCMCFNVTRAYDEVNGIEHPHIWTDKKDIEMWNQLHKSS